MLGNAVKRLVVASVLGGMVMVACTSIVPAPMAERQQSELQRVLGKIPLSFKEKGLWFGNVEKALEVNGVRRVRSWAEFEKLSRSEQDAYMNALRNIARPSNGLNALNTWTQLEQVLGFGFFDISRIAAIQNAASTTPHHPSYLEGEFDVKSVQQRLRDLEYSQRSAVGYTYYALGEDYNFNRGSPVTQIAFGALNRVYVRDDAMVTSPAANYVEDFLKTWAGKAPSLADDQAFSGLARAIPDALSAALMTRESLWEPVKERLPAYTKQEGWGNLKQWEAFAAGHGVSPSGERWWKLSLFYSDSNAAKADEAELVSRMRGYATAIPELRPNTSQETRVRWPQYPFKEACSSLTSKVEKLSQGSILSVQCIMGKDSELAWVSLIYLRDLGFLIP